jgi:hypothetical protein
MDFRFRGKSGRAADITVMKDVDPQLTSDASGLVARRASMGSRIKRDIYRTEDYAVGQNHSKRHHRWRDA